MQLRIALALASILVVSLPASAQIGLETPRQRLALRRAFSLAVIDQRQDGGVRLDGVTQGVTINNPVFTGTLSLNGSTGTTGTVAIGGSPASWSASPSLTTVTLSTALVVGTNPATVGAVRLANAGAINFRNAANGADRVLINSNTSDQVVLGDATAGVVFTSVGPHAIGAATNAGTQLIQQGIFVPSGGTGINRQYELSGTMNLEAGADANGIRLFPTFVEAASGNHNLLAVLRIQGATVTAGTATVTDAASLYIDGATTATVTGKNYQAWYAGGTTQPVRVDGEIWLGAAGALSSVAPTITSGFNTTPTVTNGTAFSFAIGTGTTASTNTAVIGLPTMTNGWSCTGMDLSDGGYVNQVASTTASASFKYYSRTLGTAINWPASVTIVFLCGGR